MLNLIFSLNTLWWLMLFLYIPACFGLIIIVLLQKGKGQGLAGAFGMGGGMDTIFGPRSSKSLPQKITYGSAAVFMTLALVMSILSGRVGRPPAPELAADSPQTSLEGLFDPNAEAMQTPVVEDGVTGGVVMVDPEPDAPAVTFEVDTDLPDPTSPEEPAAVTVDLAPGDEVAEDESGEAADEAPAAAPETDAGAEDDHQEPDAPAE